MPSTLYRGTRQIIEMHPSRREYDRACKPVVPQGSPLDARWVRKVSSECLERCQTLRANAESLWRDNSPVPRSGKSAAQWAECDRQRFERSRDIDRCKSECTKLHCNIRGMFNTCNEQRLQPCPKACEPSVCQWRNGFHTGEVAAQARVRWG